MNMKKLMAGVVASALAVTSLATVGVFAAETEPKTFNFVATTEYLTIDYSKTVEFKAAKEVDTIFAEKEYTPKFTVGINGWADGKTGDTGAVAAALEAATVKVDGEVTITIKGVGSDGKAVADVKATSKDGVFTKGDATGNTVKDGEIFFNTMAKVTSVTLTAKLKITNFARHLEPNAAKLSVTPDFASTIDADLVLETTSYASATETSNGKRIYMGNIYYFEEALNDSTYQGSQGEPNWETVGTNLLRWVNDNIEQNKGAKLRINFLKPEADVWSEWGTNAPDSYNPDILNFHNGTGAATSDFDVVMGVNLANTSKLQQGANIDPDTLSVTFDWDTLVHASTATISGNVDSIGFRLNPDNKAVQDLQNSKQGWSIGIKSIDIIIPDQADLNGENDKVISITNTTADGSVKVTGTIGAIYGGGAQDLEVTNTITDTAISYTLKLTANDGSASQLAGEVTLQLSIPAKFKGQELSSKTVKHTLNNGDVEELAIENLETYKDDGYIVVKTSKFSSFEIGFEGSNEEETTAEEPTVSEEETTAAEPEAETTTTAENGDTDTNTGADKNQPTGVALAVIPAIVAAAGVVIAKKRG